MHLRGDMPPPNQRPMSPPARTQVRGDLLIDDKPFDHLAPGGKHTTATWKQVVYDQPYNSTVNAPRLREWREWKEVVLPLFSKRGASAARCPLRCDVSGPAAPPVALSPKSTRQRLRDVAQYQQGCMLGGTDVGEEPLSPEVRPATPQHTADPIVVANLVFYAYLPRKLPRSLARARCSPTPANSRCRRRWC